MKKYNRAQIAIKKIVRSKSAVLVVALILIGGLSAGGYAYRQIDQHNSSKDSEVEHDGHLVAEPESVSRAEASKGDSKSTAKEKQGNDNESHEDNSTQASEHPATDSGESESQSMQVTTRSLSTGGSSGSTNAYSNVSLISGKRMPYLLSFSKTPVFSTSMSIDYDGIQVRESSITAGTEPELVRTIVVTQNDPDKSGNATFYVWSSPADSPLQITVSWRPMPSFSASKTGYIREDTGDAIVHTLSFKVTPNPYFGNPKLIVDSYSAALHNCKNDSLMSFVKTYNGTKNFSLRCVVPKVTCSRQPCPMISATTIKVGVSAQTSSGMYIRGGTNIDYVIPEISEYR